MAGQTVWAVQATSYTQPSSELLAPPGPASKHLVAGAETVTMPDSQQVLGAALDEVRQRAKLRAIPERAAGGGAYYGLAGAGPEAQGNGGLGWPFHE